MSAVRWVGALGGSAVVTAVAGYAASGDAATWLFNASWTLAAVVAVAGCGIGARAARGRADAAVWRAATAAAAIYLAGQLLWDAFMLAGVSVATPALPDVFFLACVGAGSVAAFRALPRGAARGYAIVDAAMIAVGAAVVSLWVTWDQLAASSLDGFGRGTALAYAIAFSALAGFAGQALLMRARHGLSAGFALLGGGALVLAYAFVSWTPHLLGGDYAVGVQAIDLLWTAGLVLAGLGGLRAVTAEQDAPRAEEGDLLAGAVLPLGLLVVLQFAPVIERDDAGLDFILDLGAATIGLLLVGRQVILALRQRELTGQRTLALDEAHHAREDLAHYLALAPTMLCRADLGSGRFTWVNPAFCEALGRTEHEILAGSFLELLHPDDLPQTTGAIAAIGEGEAVIDLENRFRHADGTYRDLLWSSVPIPDRNEIYAAARDITEIRKAEMALHRTTEELRRSNAELESFAYAASHDLSEPLRTIQGFAGLVADDEAARLAPASVARLGRVVEATGRMRGRLDAILQVARAGTAALERADVDLRALAGETIALLDSQLRETGAEVRVGELPVVRGDERQLGLLLQNLLSNAVKFGGDGTPRVELAGARENGGWHVTVADEGVGIEERHRERVFGMFERLDGGDGSQGDGIGLALCAKIAERHGGRIWVESEPGSGSTFHFTIEDDRSGDGHR